LTINSSTGVLTFIENPDYETKNSYTVTVTASDGTNTASQTLTINVTNVNESPYFTSPTTLSLPENTTTVGTVTATDYEQGNSEDIRFYISGCLTFGAEDCDYFAISETGDLDGNGISDSAVLVWSHQNNSGQATTPDYENPEDYNLDNGYKIVVHIEMSVGSNKRVHQQVFTVNVTDVNETPVFYACTQSCQWEGPSSDPTTVIWNKYEEDDNPGLWVGEIDVADPENNNITYSLSGSNPSLSIDSNGLIRIANPDYETQNTYTDTITALDGVNNKDIALIINIKNVNEYAPVFTSADTFSVAENQTAVGTVTATDGDTSETLTYSLSGTDASALSINSSSGVITFNTAPDYETKSSYSVTVNVTDCVQPYGSYNCYFGVNHSGPSYSTVEIIHTATQALTINISNVNESPMITSSTSFSVAENQTGVGNVTATDGDGDSLTYSLSGTDASSFSISSSGVITFNSVPDYETKTSYSITVNVSDGTNTTTQSVTVSVTNVNDNNPVVTSASSFSAAENQTAVGTVTATDGDTSDTLSYSLTGTDASALSINSSSGVITFNSAPDYETKSSYSITVNVSDGTNTTTQAMTISINNLNDNPPIISDSWPSGLVWNVNENTTSPFVSLAPYVSDADGALNVLTYSVIGADASYFSIDASGNITLLCQDYETCKDAYSLGVTVSDGTYTDTKTAGGYNVVLVNVPEPPTFTYSFYEWVPGHPTYQGYTFDENILANGEDPVPPLQENSDFSALTNYWWGWGEGGVGSCAVGGIDAPYFTTSVDSSGCNLTWVINGDYEIKDSYSVSFTLSNANGSVTENIIIKIADVREAPTISGLPSSTTVEENQTSTNATALIYGDAGYPLTTSVTWLNNFRIDIDNSSTGVITYYPGTPDYENLDVWECEQLTGSGKCYPITVSVTDGTYTTTDQVTVNYSDLRGVQDGASSSAGDWNKGITFTPSSQGQSTSTIFSRAVGTSDPFQPWALTTVFKVDSSSTTDQRIVQISDYDNTSQQAGSATTLKDSAYLGVSNGSVIFKVHHFNNGSDTSYGYTLTSPSNTISSNTWYGIYVDFDGNNNGSSGFDKSAFRAYLVDLTTDSLTDLKTSGTETINYNPSSGCNPLCWINDGQTYPNGQTAFDWYQDDYLVGYENFQGTIASVVTTSLMHGNNNMPISGEISTMVTDPRKWLTDYKIGEYFRATGPNAANAGSFPVFAINDEWSSLSTQVYLMNDVGGDTHERIKNQVLNGQCSGTFCGDTDLITTGLTSSSLVTVSIEPPPIITSSAAFTVAENQTAVGTVTATNAGDTNNSETLTYSLTGADASALSISSSGVITFNSAPDYETKTSYSVIANVSDGGDRIATQVLTITITNVYPE